MFSFSLLHELYRYPDLDLIHLHTGKRLGAIGAYVAAKRKLPYVISLHGGVYDVPAAEAQTWTAPTKGTFEWGKALGWWTGARRVLDNASAILCVGQNEQAEVQSRFPRKNVIHLPNGVDAQRFASGDGAGFRARHSIPASAFVIVVVGRIDPQKNQLLALRILAEMRRGGLHAHLVLIGPVTNADYDATLNREIEAGGLTEFVTLSRGLRSHDPELVNAYHAASLFLLPSIHEPFGIVILEAWAAGLPVVASRVGGVPSFVINGEDGALFPPDDLDAACSLVRHLAANPEARLRLANTGQKKARQEFGWDRISKRVEGIYEEAARANSLRK